MSNTLESLAARAVALASEAQSIATELGRLSSPAVELTRAPAVTADPNWRTLPDGTRQFIGTPEHGINTVLNTTPAVPPEWGVGARFLVAGIEYGEPMTVKRVGDGIVFAMHEGVETAFYPNQCHLVEAAPV